MARTELDYQIPRNSLALLLLGQVAVIAPHSGRLAFPILLLAVIAIGWRIMVYLGRWSYPPALVKFLLIILATAGVLGGYGNLVGLEPALAFLVSAYSLKLLEMWRKRDAFVLIFMGYFVAATTFLYYQTISFTLYMVLACTVVTGALIGLNQSTGHDRPLATLWLAARLLLQAVPLMLILFVLFPRVSPLWAVPLQSNAARTGLSEEITPGDIARLSRSDALAFRATFSGESPPQSELYWRSLVYTEFDGRTWSQRRMPRTRMSVVQWWNEPGGALGSITGHYQPTATAYDYEVIMEPTQQRWLVSLSAPEPLSSGVGVLRDFRLMADLPLQQKMQYRVRSHPDALVETRLAPWIEQAALELPHEGNPRSRQLGLSLRADSSSVLDLVERTLIHYRENNFVYTLSPPLMTGDSIDQFLFEGRAGFCAHFAGSFVYLMRAAGVPARMVGGYQGGEVNSISKHVTVRQFDAHAWAEIWIPELGWTRFDPTALVSPERISSGLEAAVQREGSFLADAWFSPLRYRGVAWLTELRMHFDYLEHSWNQWVVGYDATLQLQFVASWLGEMSHSHMMWIMAGSIIGFILLATLISTVTPALRVSPEQRLRSAFLTRLKLWGYAPEGGESVSTFALRVAQSRPADRDWLMQFADLYEGYCYAPASDASRQLLRRQMRRILVRYPWYIPWRRTAGEHRYQ